MSAGFDLDVRLVSYVAPSLSILRMAEEFKATADK